MEFHRHCAKAHGGRGRAGGMKRGKQQREQRERERERVLYERERGVLYELVFVCIL